MDHTESQMQRQSKLRKKPQQSSGVGLIHHFHNKNLPVHIVHIYELLHTYLIRELQHLQATWISSVSCLCICIIINLEELQTVCSTLTIFA